MHDNNFDWFVDQGPGINQNPLFWRRATIFLSLYEKKMFLGNWELNLAFFFLQPFWYNLINQLVTHIQNLIYQSHGYFISFREYLTNTERSSNTLKDEMCLELWAVMKYFLLLEILWQIKNLSLKLPRALTPGQIKSETYATFIKITIVYSWWACYNEGTVDT